MNDVPAFALEPKEGVTDARGRRRTSLVDNPVKRVHEIVSDAIVAVGGRPKRKALLDQCFKEGIAFYTARTQVQKALQRYDDLIYSQKQGKALDPSDDFDENVT